MGILSDRNVNPNPDQGTFAERPDAEERHNGFRYYAVDRDALYEVHEGEWVQVSGMSEAMKPISFIKTNGDLTFAANTGAFVEADSGGTSTARPLDLVIPATRGPKVGDWIRVNASGYSASTASQTYLDMATVVNGTVTNRLAGNAAWGIMSWALVASRVAQISGGISYQLQNGDFEADGSVRLRLMAYNTHATTTRVILAQALFPFRVEVSGPFA